MKDYIRGMRKCLRIGGFIAVALGIGGCLPFGQGTHYSIDGLAGMPEAQSYVQAILDDRLAEDIDAEEGSEDFARAEAYREETIAADLRKAMKAKGYYEAEVDYADDEDAPLSGVYRITPGPLYTIKSITVEPEDVAGMFDVTGVSEGDPLEAEAVLRAQAELYKQVQKDRCYFSLDVSHAVVLDQETQTAALTYTALRGDEAKLGPVIFEGQESVKVSYLNKLVPWKAGDCFRRAKIETLKTRLLESGLFARAESVLPEAVPEDGSVPVTIVLKERAQRSVKAGLNYYTDTGLGVLLGWEHRNLFGAAETLEIEANINQIEQGLNYSFTKPFFLRKDQSLEIDGELSTEDSDAYEATTFDTALWLHRDFSRKSSGSVGVAFSLSEIDDGFDEETYGLVSFPVGLAYDSRDDALDPHKGWLLTGDVEPFVDAFGNSDPFTKLQAGARTYFNLAEDPDLVLAVRGKVGSIIGDESADIPATERFYAGGGGSVRGFGYQEVGPYANGEPAGGRSLVTGSGELRWRLENNFGAVAFVDAGSVSESSSPDFDNFSVGAGVGVRYFTGFGPLRFDVAVPLNRRDEVDQNYQFYISIGQAF